MWYFRRDFDGSRGRGFKAFGAAPAMGLVTRARAVGSLGDLSAGEELSHLPLSQKHGQN